MPVDYYRYDAEDAINGEELELYALLMDYRAGLGLPAIPLSASLTTVAARHVVDTVYNIGEFVVGAPGENAGHGWSDAPYDGRDSATYGNMWYAPQRLGTAYTGYGFEISIGYVGQWLHSVEMTAETALAGWQSSAPHNAVIVNAGPWTAPWNAIGVAILDGVSHVWFGNAADPAGPPGFEGVEPPTQPPQAPQPEPDPAAGRGFSGEPGADGLYDAQEIALLYEVAFARRPDLPGLTFWIDKVHAQDGFSVLQIAAAFYETDAFAQALGRDPAALDDATIVEALYTNVLDRPGLASQNDPAGYAFWLGAVEGGLTRPELMRHFAISPENVANAAYVHDLARGEDGGWLF